MVVGASLVNGALATLDEVTFSAPTRLPGWTRRHLAAHVAANAEAVGRLVHWAATGEPTPMYASAEQRLEDIQAGSRMPAAELIEWCARSAADLDAAMAGLTEEQWATQVVTAQGRVVPASETPWMRAREVMVHAVDLDAGIGFADLPVDFLRALCDDIVGKRSAGADAPGSGPALTVTASDTGDRWRVAGAGQPVDVTGTIADLASYLAGREADGVVSVDGGARPALPPWL